jgi:hypothetical protein
MVAFELRVKMSPFWMDGLEQIEPDRALRRVKLNDFWAVNGWLTSPNGLPKISDRKSLCFPSPFVFRPTTLEVAFDQQHI